MNTNQAPATAGQKLQDNIRAVKEIADGVVRVSKAWKEIQDGPLTEEAILVLLVHATGLSQKNIKKVLAGLGTLEEMYVKPREQRKK